MKPAHEPPSSRPKPCASFKKPHESCPFAAPCGSRRKKNCRGQTSAFPSETSRFAPLILAHRVQPSPGCTDNLHGIGFVEGSAAHGSAREWFVLRSSLGRGGGGGLKLRIVICRTVKLLYSTDESGKIFAAAAVWR